MKNLRKFKALKYFMKIFTFRKLFHKTGTLGT